MPPISSFRLLPGLALVGGALIGPVPGLAQEVIQLNKWQESGIREVQGASLGYRPHNVLLEAKKPEDLKQAPEGLANPFYGVIELGPPKSPAKIRIVADIAKGTPAQMRLDSNGNGDFTDDPPCLSTNVASTNQDGKITTNWKGEGMVTFPFGAGTRTGKLIFYGPQTLPSAAGSARMALTYFTDYGLVGELKLDGQTVPAALTDAGAVGCFRINQEPLLNPLLHLLVPNPRNNRIGISSPMQRPFEFNGKWWAVTNLTLDGTFQIVASSKPPEPKKVEGPDLSPGKKAFAFTGKLLGGKTVKFPEDYKGKVVLVDFWATWCGPCIAELPNVLKAYEKYHPQGLEILGVSLDREDWEEKLADFTKKKNMTWPQVYDGKYWGAEVAKLYGITSIPRMLLVDGDTGVILASQNIRGEMLAPAIEKALSGKTK